MGRLVHEVRIALQSPHGSCLRRRLDLFRLVAPDGPGANAERFIGFERHILRIINLPSTNPRSRLEKDQPHHNFGPPKKHIRREHALERERQVAFANASREVDPA